MSFQFLRGDVQPFQLLNCLPPLFIPRCVQSSAEPFLKGSLQISVCAAARANDRRFHTILLSHVSLNVT